MIEIDGLFFKSPVEITIGRTFEEMYLKALVYGHGENFYKSYYFE